MKSAILINGKPLSEYTEDEIPQAVAEDNELTEKEIEAADAATD